MENKSKRIVSFDLLKALAIYLVVWGHSIQHLLSSNPHDDIIYTGIYSFHMPLFMIIAGFFCTRTLQIPFSSFISYKGRQLIIPCLSWAVLLWLFWSCLFYIFKGASPSLSGLFDNLVQNYWFLKSLFCCYLLAWCGYHSGLAFIYWVVITLLLSIFIPLYNINLMYPAFLVGILLKRYDRFFVFVKNNAFYLVLLFLLLVVICGKWIWDYRLLRILIGIVGGCSFVGFFTSRIRFRENSRVLDSLSYVGSQTLGIYLLQGVILDHSSQYYSTLIK